MSDEDPDVNMVGTIAQLTDEPAAAPRKKHPIGFDIDPAHYRPRPQRKGKK